MNVHLFGAVSGLTAASSCKKVETLSKQMLLPDKSGGVTQIKSMQCATDPSPLPLPKLMTVGLNTILDLAQL